MDGRSVPFDAQPLKVSSIEQTGSVKPTDRLDELVAKMLKWPSRGGDCRQIEGIIGRFPQY